MFLIKCIALFLILDFHVCSGSLNVFQDSLNSVWKEMGSTIGYLECKKSCVFYAFFGSEQLIKCIILKCQNIVADFYLFTGYNEQKPIKLGKDATEFPLDRNKKVVFLVHGLGSNYSVHWVNHTRDVFLAFHDYNVIAFNWKTNIEKFIGVTQYGMVVVAEAFGELMGKFLRRLISDGRKSSDIYLVGHSVGAHIISRTAKYLKAKDGTVLNRITGLDPAGMIFDLVPSSSRIDKTDAEFVDCIFSSAGLIGLKYPRCKANFYPNYYGTTQPGVTPSYFSTAVYSHRRAPHLFAESLLPGHKFYAQQCHNLPRKHMSPTNCNHNNKTILMGYPASPKLTGIFFLKTRGQYPFALDVHETEEEKEIASKIMVEFE